MKFSNMDIQRKILALLLSAGLLSFFALAMVSFISMYQLSADAEESGRRMGEAAADFTEEFAIARAKKRVADISQEKAQLIMEQAKAQSKEMFENSYQQARQLRVNANNYANQVFDHLILNVGNALEVLKQARDELQKMPVEPELPPAEPQPMAPAELPEE